MAQVTFPTARPRPARHHHPHPDQRRRRHLSRLRPPARSSSSPTTSISPAPTPRSGPNEPRFGMLPPAGRQARLRPPLLRHDHRLRPPPARHRPARLPPNSACPLPEGIYLAVLGPSYRNPRRNPRLPHPRRHPRRHVHRARDHRRPPHGPRGARPFARSPNPAAGVSTEVIHHEEVMDIGRQSEAALHRPPHRHPAPYLAAKKLS